MRFQPIYDIAELLHRKRIERVVLCPGSRCAPLTLAFVRHPQLRCFTISDERSAGFIALGMAQETGVPVAVVCTSGSAACNLAPAVAEAYFQNISLLVITADRPEEWIDQLDGQTIRQQGIYGVHVKKAFHLPNDLSHADSAWHVNRIFNEAVNLAVEFPKGPVHVNAPFREPLYPDAHQEITFSKDIRVTETVSSQPTLNDADFIPLLKAFEENDKTLVVSGQNDYDPKTLESISTFMAAHQVPLIGEVLTNLHALDGIIRTSDLFLGHLDDGLKKNLAPDLLITFGKSLVSRNLKAFLRKYRPKVHWHIQPAGGPADTFQHLTTVIRSSPDHFFKSLSAATMNAGSVEGRAAYRNQWTAQQNNEQKVVKEFLREYATGEIKLVSDILQHLPLRCNLHLANSMAVRYVNLLGIPSSHKNVCIFGNRGTSGIDGCSSTAVGHALSTDILNILITGDMAFFYDRNAFWHNYPISNLRIVVLNNHGGVIFGMIDGPSSLPEANEYFITHQPLDAKSLCEEFGFGYLHSGLSAQKSQIKDFLTMDGKTKVLELETDPQETKSIFAQLKDKMKKHYEA